jgi:hypothetical protein
MAICHDVRFTFGCIFSFWLPLNLIFGSIEAR